MTKHLREDEVIPYLDARLDPGSRTRVEHHLSECAACRAKLKEFRALLGVMEEWTASEPSAGFESALRKRLVEEGQPRSRWAWLHLRPAFGIALAVVVGLALGLALWHPAPAPPTSVVQVTEEAGPEEAARDLAPDQGLEGPTVSAGLAEELAQLDNPVLYENYELLEQFDVLFESSATEKKEL